MAEEVSTFGFRTYGKVLVFILGELKLQIYITAAELQ